MQSGYFLILSMDELRSLKPETKQDLASKCPEFAKIAGVATPETATPAPPTVDVNGVATVPAARNQPNQQSTIDPALQGMPGIPGMPPAASPMNPVVPSGYPPTTGQVPPGLPQQQPAMLPTMPATNFPPQQPVNSFPAQAAAAPQEQVSAAPAAATGSITRTDLITKVVPKIMSHVGQPEAIAGINACVQAGHLATANIHAATDEKAHQIAAVMAHVAGHTVESLMALP